MFFNGTADGLAEFCCLGFPFVWYEPILCCFIWELFFYFHMDSLV